MTRYDVVMVDDETDLSAPTVEYLSGFGLRTIAVETAEAAGDLVRANEVGVVLLDVNLPGRNGFEFCRELRAHSNVPIVFISARGSDDDQILALSIGGDDYITKPFSLAVLFAKVRRILDRTTPRARPGFDDGWLRVDAATGRTWVNGAEVRLKAMEDRLLRYLVDRAGEVVSKADLFEHVWEEPITSDGTLTVHIARVRAKIEPDQERPRYIRTVWGRGYLFDPPSRPPGRT